MNNNRTIETISQEYATLAQRMGHAYYQVLTLQKDIENFNATMRDLNLEAAAVKAKSEAPAEDKAE